MSFLKWFEKRWISSFSWLKFENQCLSYGPDLNHGLDYSGHIKWRRPKCWFNIRNIIMQPKSWNWILYPMTDPYVIYDIYVWYIYLHLPHKATIHVGKRYTLHPMDSRKFLKVKSSGSTIRAALEGGIQVGRWDPRYYPRLRPLWKCWRKHWFCLTWGYIIEGSLNSNFRQYGELKSRWKADEMK